MSNYQIIEKPVTLISIHKIVWVMDAKEVRGFGQGPRGIYNLTKPSVWGRRRRGWGSGGRSKKWLEDRGKKRLPFNLHKVHQIRHATLASHICTASTGTWYNSSCRIANKRNPSPPPPLTFLHSYHHIKDPNAANKLILKLKTVKFLEHVLW